MGEIKEKYIDGDDELLFRLIYFIFVESADPKTIDYVISEFNISNDKIRSLLPCIPSKSSREFGPSSYDYWNYRITTRISISDKLSGLKKLESIVGEKAL